MTKIKPPILWYIHVHIYTYVKIYLIYIHIWCKYIKIKRVKIVINKIINKPPYIIIKFCKIKSCYCCSYHEFLNKDILRQGGWRNPIITVCEM